jgi:hypothetical protein
LGGHDVPEGVAQHRGERWGLAGGVAVIKAGAATEVELVALYAVGQVSEDPLATLWVAARPRTVRPRRQVSRTRL